MKEDQQGRSELGPSARTLGVRAGTDVPAIQPSENVQSSQGGLSVSPDSPLKLPIHRRPLEFQGTGKDPVWAIEAADLRGDLSYRADPTNPNHGFIEPARTMTLDEYQRAIEQTQPLWQKATARPSAGSQSNDH